MIKFANWREILNSKKNLTFLQDLTNYWYKSKFRAIYKFKPNETTDLVGIQDLLLYWVYQINWGLKDVFLMINKFEDIDENYIITVIE